MTGDGGPATARLHLHRGWGAAYTVVALVLLGIVVAAAVDALSSGRLLTAVVTFVIGLALAAFIGKAGLELLAPDLTVDARGVHGRLRLTSPRVDAGWDDVTIDVAEPTPGRGPRPARTGVIGGFAGIGAGPGTPDRFRLTVATSTADSTVTSTDTNTEVVTVTLYSRSWFGFGDFVMLVATSAQATRSLTPAAQQQMLSLLGVQRPDTEPHPG